VPPSPKIRPSQRNLKSDVDIDCDVDIDSGYSSDEREAMEIRQKMQQFKEDGPAMAHHSDNTKLAIKRQKMYFQR